MPYIFIFLSALLGIFEIRYLWKFMKTKDFMYENRFILWYCRIFFSLMMVLSILVATASLLVSLRKFNIF